MQRRLDISRVRVQQQVTMAQIHNRQSDDSFVTKGFVRSFFIPLGWNEILGTWKFEQFLQKEEQVSVKSGFQLRNHNRERKKYVGHTGPQIELVLFKARYNLRDSYESINQTTPIAMVSFLHLEKKRTHVGLESSW